MTEVQLQNSDPRTVRDVTIIVRGTERKGFGCSMQTVQNHKVVYLERLLQRYSSLNRDLDRSVFSVLK